MSIKPINHYSMTNASSVYDEEAMTALELAGHTAAKVNEAIEAFNEHESKTNKQLTEQETTIIPNAVHSEVKKYVDDGTFDETIENHIGNLEARVDNLIESYKPGSTTADAELYDIRMGEGEQYASAGDHVRSKATKKEINRFFDSDIFSREKNLYTYGDVSFNYPANGNPFPPVSDREIPLMPGNYLFVVTKTDAPRLMVTYRTSADAVETANRILDVSYPKTGVYRFTVPEREGGGLIRVYYGSSGTQTPFSCYLNKCYIYPEENKVKIPHEFINEGLSIFDTVEVIKQKGKNLYKGGYITPVKFDGVSLEVTCNTWTNITPGNYLIKIGKTLPRVIIATENVDRLLDVTGMSETEFYKFIVPEGVTRVQIIGYMSTSTEILVPAGSYTLDDIIIIEDNGKPCLPDYLTRYGEIMSKIGSRNIFNKFFGIEKTSNTIIQLNEAIHAKKNYSINFTGFFTDGTTRINVGNYKGVYGGCYVNIRSNVMSVFSRLNENTLLDSYAFSEISLTGNISVNIHVHTNLATITITTDNRIIVWDNAPWTCSNGTLFADSNTIIENASLTWNCNDLDKKVWLFGDSYLSISEERITGQLIKRGFENYLVSGYPGASSSAELASLETLLKVGTPDVIIWCLGMNNGDNMGMENLDMMTNINKEWLTATQRVIQICEENNIGIILATIPSVSTVFNGWKNKWVRESGYRYIDFDAAVITSGSWREGLLSSDGVHPTTIGASVLASRMLIDAPEIMR